MATDVAPDMAVEQQRIVAEIREIDLLIDSTQTEITRFRSREDGAKAKLDHMKFQPQNFQREEIFAASEELAAAIGRRMTMEAQLASLESKKKMLDRVKIVFANMRPMAPAPAPEPAPAPVERERGPEDNARLLQAVVDTQEDERRRIARQVHDGPAQAMANVVLQSEISERLYDVDPQRSRQELAGLRQIVNKTLQELRGFIFELRPMILDDLGLVPTLRRYIQTLIDKHAIRIDFSSNGRDRRLRSEDEVAIFRLIQDSLVDQIENGQAKDLILSMNWRDESLEITLHSDAKDRRPGADGTSGLRRTERLELLKGDSHTERRPNGTVMVTIRVPLRPAPQLVG